MTDNKRIKECKRKVIAAINEATLQPNQEKNE